MKAKIKKIRETDRWTGENKLIYSRKKKKGEFYLFAHLREVLIHMQKLIPIKEHP